MKIFDIALQKLDSLIMHDETKNLANDLEEFSKNLSLINELYNIPETEHIKIEKMYLESKDLKSKKIDTDLKDLLDTIIEQIEDINDRFIELPKDIDYTNFVNLNS